jgi:hypothetical protein
LDEIRRTPTVRIMEALQGVAAGDPRAGRKLIEWLKLHGNIPLITRALTSEYLRDVGDPSLLGKVSRLVASLPENAFGYKFAVKPPTTPTKRDHQGLHEVWMEVTT